MAKTPTDLYERNLLLRALAPADRRLLSGQMEGVHLSRGDVLFEPGDDVDKVTFPLDATVVTLLVTMRDGRTVETATVGREGAIGGVVSQGSLPAFNRCVVQLEGSALRIPATRLQKAKQGSVALRNALTRYADCLLAQVLQSVACNALHPIEERCAKWLLTLQDRTGNPELALTQEQLADMLGVRRTYVSGVLRRLQDRALIRVGRGRITILARNVLETAACECHARVREHFTEVLGAHYRPDGKIVSVAPLTDAVAEPELVKLSG